MECRRKTARAMGLAVKQETQKMPNFWSVGMERAFPNSHIMEQQAVMLSAHSSQHPENMHPKPCERD